MRLSNYLLWQLAYTEFYVTDTLWPDFSRWDFLRAIASFQRRSRRLGVLPPHDAAKDPGGRARPEEPALTAR